VQYNAQQRLDEYWDFQLRARFGTIYRGKDRQQQGKKVVEEEAQLRERRQHIALLQKELLETSGVVLPPVSESGAAAALHDRFHALARAHGDLHVDSLPGQVPEEDEEGRVLQCCSVVCCSVCSVVCCSVCSVV
jgi:hypothetical protein